MDKLNVYNYTYHYNTLLNLSQTFIDIVRNSGGKNKGRLLLVASPNKEFKLAFYSDYKIPEDPNNYFATPQLVRTGALYHDIGKISNPIYFTENQPGG